MIKRDNWIISMIILVLIFVCSGCRSENQEFIEYQMNTENEIFYFDISADENKIIYITDLGIDVYHMDEAGEGSYKSVIQGKYTALYLLDSTIICFDHIRQRLLSADENGEMLNQVKLDRDLDAIIKIGKDAVGNLFLLGTSSGQSVFYLFNEKLEIIYMYEWKYLINDIYPYDSNQMLVLKNRSLISVFDLQQKSDIANINLNQRVNKMVYNSTEETLYLMDNNNLYKVLLDTKSDFLDVKNKRMISKDEIQDFTIKNNKIYILDSQNVITMVDVSYKDESFIEEECLVLLEQEKHINDINVFVDIINELHRDGQIDYYIEQQVIERSKFNIKLMSGDSDFDLFAFSNRDCYNNKDTISNIVEDLNNYSEIMMIKDLLYENIVELCTFNNQLSGMPIDVEARCLSANTVLFDSIGIPMPDIYWKWDEFIQLINDCIALRETEEFYLFESPTEIGLIHTMLNCYGFNFIDYESNTCDFTNNDFIELLETTKKIIEHGLLYDKIEHDEYSKVLLKEKSISFLNDMPLENKEKYLAFPYKENMTSSIAIDMICMNKHSNKKDIAAKSLSIIFDESFVEEGGIHVPLNEQHYGMIQYKVDKMTDLAFDSSQDTLNLYRKSIYNSRNEYYKPDISLIITEHFEQYINGKIDAKQAAIDINNRVSLFIRE